MMGNFLSSKTKFKNYKFPSVVKTQRPSQLKVKIESSQSFKNNLIPAEDHKIYQFKTKKVHTQFQVYELPQTLTVLTYNIWFENNNVDKRRQCIMKMLGQSEADFICLQEVTQNFIEILHSGKWGWVNDYYLGVFKLHWYDTIILSKYKCRFTKIPFQTSGMQRSMTFAELVGSKGENIIVGNMHYESLNNTEERISQIQQVQKITSHCKRVIIVGDYNFSDKYSENKEIQKEFVDLWLYTREGNLEGSETMPKTPKFSSWRPDHVLCRTPNSLKGSKIDKIGDFTIHPYQNDELSKIKEDGIVRCPSDHFGLYAAINMIDKQ